MAATRPPEPRQPSAWLNCNGRRLDLRRPRVMGVLNITPDSFSDGGQFQALSTALNHALEMVTEGADIIDVGGESTRPRSNPVGIDEELDRVIPVIEHLRAESDVIISIDSMKPEVMRAAVSAGADLINDVNALRSPGALEVAVETGVAACFMHMQGSPKTMQQQPHYHDVLAQVADYLRDRADEAQARGLSADKIILDPGFGFGKTLEHNLRLFANLAELRDLGYPLLVGVSRKTMLAGQAQRGPSHRLPAGLSAAALAVWLGASIIRTHDVWQTVDAISMVAQIARYRNEPQEVYPKPQ